MLLGQNHPPDHTIEGSRICRVPVCSYHIKAKEAQMHDVERSEEGTRSMYNILKTVGLLLFITALGDDHYTWYLFGLGLFVMGLFGPVGKRVILSARWDRIVYLIAVLVVILVGVAQLAMAIWEVVGILTGSLATCEPLSTHPARSAVTMMSQNVASSVRSICHAC
jgi:hypothetical protein